jgi:hypothetical protein
MGIQRRGRRKAAAANPNGETLMEVLGLGHFSQSSSVWSDMQFLFYSSLFFLYF